MTEISKKVQPGDSIFISYEELEYVLNTLLSEVLDIDIHKLSSHATDNILETIGKMIVFYAMHTINDQATVKLMEDLGKLPLVAEVTIDPIIPNIREIANRLVKDGIIKTDYYYEVKVIPMLGIILLAQGSIWRYAYENNNMST